MTEADRRREEARARQLVRRHMERWAGLALPHGQLPAAHHRLLMQALGDVSEGTTDRLMVLMPPGSAKSTYGSVLFVPWWFARHKGSQVIACAHTAQLAEYFGLRVRSLIGEHGRRLGLALDGRRAAGEFGLQGGGSYFAVGVQGAVTGRRADLVVIDDPVRGRADAHSPRRREQLWDWYRAELITRLKPGGRVVLIMTRWHEDDLGGRLLEREPGWRCLRLPALAEPGDPLGRAPGEALWPQWEDGAALARKREALGEHAFSALFQQSPRGEQGMLFRIDQMRVVDAAPLCRAVRGWDLAASEARGGGDPDWTVGLKLGTDGTGQHIILDVVRLRGGPQEVVEALRRTAAADGPDVPIHLPQDPGQAGKSQVAFLAGQLAGFTVHASLESGPKQARAMPVASQLNIGNVAMLRAPWNAALREELAGFPHGRKDDQVDALSRAFAALASQATPTRRTDHLFLAR